MLNGACLFINNCLQSKDERDFDTLYRKNHSVMLAVVPCRCLNRKFAFFKMRGDLFLLDTETILSFIAMKVVLELNLHLAWRCLDFWEFFSITKSILEPSLLVVHVVYLLDLETQCFKIPLNCVGRNYIMVALQDNPEACFVRKTISEARQLVFRKIWMTFNLLMSFFDIDVFPDLQFLKLWTSIFVGLMNGWHSHLSIA